MIRDHRVFDAHLHVQPWSMLRPEVRATLEGPDAEVALALQEDPARLEAWLDREGVDRAVLVNYVSPAVMGYTAEVNAWVARYCRGRARLVPMGGVDPRAPDPGGAVDRLVREHGLRALKLHPAHQLVAPHAYATGEVPGLRDVYAAAERHRLPVTIHTGTSVFPGAKNRFTDPIYADDVAVDFPRLTLVLAHAGRPLWMETAFFLARRHPNVHLDLSGIPPARLLEYLPRLPEIAGKCLFGSDWPSPGVRSVRANVEAFLDLPLPDEAKRAILWDNAARIFG